MKPLVPPQDKPIKPFHKANRYGKNSIAIKLWKKITKQLQTYYIKIYSPNKITAAVSNFYLKSCYEL